MEGAAAGRRSFAALFLIAQAGLMYEILLTRIFSVSLYYHLAFMAISLAMFGMTVGALVVYLQPEAFPAERTRRSAGINANLCAVTMVLSLLGHIYVPLVAATGLGVIAFTYLATSVPFVFSGICICLILTRFPKQISTLYAVDLAGAAAGCILLVYLLKFLDAPTAVFAVASLPALAAALLASESGSRSVMAAGLAIVLSYGGFLAYSSAQDSSVIRLFWAKNNYVEVPFYEKWNSFSCVQVVNDQNTEPFGWQLSNTYHQQKKVREMFLVIDGIAGTVLTSFDGDVTELDYLKYDVTNLVYYIRPGADVLVIGGGGGRDVLSALTFKNRSVVAVEMNGEILDVVNNRYGDYTGHLNRRPGVMFVNDEARSYISRVDSRFDIIQISLIDTFAATASGAFALSENSLYTVEAWKSFLLHLKPGGVLSVSRWYFQDRPGEIYRTTSLASAALAELGIKEPRGHILIIKKMRPVGHPEEGNGVGTILVSRQPFTQNDFAILKDVAAKMEFEPVLTPHFALDATFAALASGRDPWALASAYPIDISPPTDDRPFFFNMLRFRDVLHPAQWQLGITSFNMKAVVVLAFLLVLVTLLTVLFILTPLFLKSKKAALGSSAPLIGFFAAIGFGFMLIEVSQMQRMIVFLGHPTYGLTVVLFSLLLGVGIGSYLTGRMTAKPGRNPLALALLLLLGCLAAFGLVTPFVIQTFQASGAVFRILVAGTMLSLMGIFLGMPFPLGMKIAFQKAAGLTPWLWGINGATSVCAAVLAMVIAISSGITAAFWTGFAFYLAALACTGLSPLKSNGQPS